ncbi:MULTISPECIES: hypothetical protein [Rhizobium]|uniref:Uncharacterized protein n=1 Tax=Rhizobium dioscoreae TaxID=2653122 RepID=A0ABQ0Z7Q0_9HYPH|nr:MULTISPECIES: hypothetical protein [Rhizobium]MCZ3374806.1 hypothetical protein [Rhizobium sp. AG207R]GES51402.1 hypothetical protein RsS93_40160 [Rhizobium dioscoreae]GLU82854.1 hypothetical protein Rhsp01_40300 [Rhizobium sp. NBRC 114257]
MHALPSELQPGNMKEATLLGAASQGMYASRQKSGFCGKARNLAYFTLRGRSLDDAYKPVAITVPEMRQRPSAEELKALLK